MWSGELRRQPPHDARVGAPAAADLCRVGPPEASRPGGSESSSVRLEVDVRDSGWPSMSVSASGSMPAAIPAGNACTAGTACIPFHR